jgi:Fe-Mn family superoxide dismutase
MFSAIELPFAYDALQPYISSKTIEFHHDKHHVGYANKLNEIAEKYPSLNEYSLEEILSRFQELVPQEIQTSVHQTASQTYNHNIYWQSVGADHDQKPTGQLALRINDVFGSYDNFVSEFSKLGVSQFGSGWVWLSLDERGSLMIEKTSNEDTPLLHGRTPLMTMDVWEHAYYLDYQNKRPEYITNFFKIINWKSIGEKYNALSKI